MSEIDVFPSWNMKPPKRTKILPKSSPDPPKSSLGPPKSSLEPSKTQFLKDTLLKIVQGGVPFVKFAIFSQLGSILEAQDPPKSRPKPEKIDVVKQDVFNIDFGRVQASFWKDFCKVF